MMQQNKKKTECGTQYNRHSNILLFSGVKLKLMHEAEFREENSTGQCYCS